MIEEKTEKVLLSKKKKTNYRNVFIHWNYLVNFPAINCQRQVYALQRRACCGASHRQNHKKFTFCLG